MVKKGQFYNNLTQGYLELALRTIAHEILKLLLEKGSTQQLHFYSDNYNFTQPLWLDIGQIFCVYFLFFSKTQTILLNLT